MEWYCYLFQVPRTLGGAVSITLCALIVGILGYRSFRKAFREIDTYRAGLRGERHAAQYLHDHCSPLGYRVFHDLPCNSDSGNPDFNIDHILIGPAGIFPIETKNWSKPPQGTKAELLYTNDGETELLAKPNGSFDTHAIRQARANADFLRTLLARHTGRSSHSLPVHAVLLFPGWWITSRSRCEKLWIFSDNTLHKFLPKEPAHLSPEDIALYAEALTAYLRGQKK
jgi:hypothetical protein